MAGVIDLVVATGALTAILPGEPQAPRLLAALLAGPRVGFERRTGRSCSSWSRRALVTLGFDSPSDPRLSFVELINNDRCALATINFSVPAEVKQAFNETFARENKGAVLTRLMVQAIEER